MIKEIRHQTLFALKQIPAIGAFFILLAIVLFNFVSNIFAFQGSDVVEMYHPAKILAISYNRVYYNADVTLLLIQIYPILVVCPAGFTLISEKNRKIDYLLISRISGVKYYVSKAISSFFATMIIFVTPFFIEMVLTLFSFPIAATGDFTNLNKFSPEYVEMAEHYFFSELFQQHPYLYTALGILIFGIFSGTIGMFTVALSALITFPYKILLFLPAFVLLNATLYIPEIIGNLPFSLRWYDYILLFDDNLKSGRSFSLFMISLLVVSVVCSILKGVSDQI